MICFDLLRSVTLLTARVPCAVRGVSAEKEVGSDPAITRAKRITQSEYAEREVEGEVSLVPVGYGRLTDNC